MDSALMALAAAMAAAAATAFSTGTSDWETVFI
jgi:hypothetical protein